MRNSNRFSSLRLYVFLLVCPMLVAFALIFSSAIHTAMPKTLPLPEEWFLRRHTSMLEKLLAASRENLLLAARETATRDQLHDFVRGGNPKFIAPDGEAAALRETFQLDFLIIKDPAGNDLYASFRDPEARKDLSSRLGAFLNHAREGHPAATAKENTGEEGVFLFNGAAYNIAAAPIMPDHRAAETAGTLIMGEALNTDFFRRLTRDEKTDFVLQEGSETATARPGPGRDGDALSTRIPLPSLNGAPLELVITEPRPVAASGRTFLNPVNILALLAALLFPILLYAGIVRLVLRPLEQLSADISGFSTMKEFRGAGGISSRKYSNSREFMALCDAITGMQQKLGRSQISLELLSRILNGVDAHIYVVDPADDTLLFINDNMQERFEIHGNPVGQKCWRVLQENQENRCSFCPQHQLLESPSEPVTWEDNNPLTGRRYANTATLMEWMDGRMACLHHSVDITSVRETENYLQKRLEQQELMADISRSFISTESSGELINKALERAGTFLGISKILLARVNRESETLDMQYEWFSDRNDCVRPEQTRVPFHPGTPEYTAFEVHRLPFLAHDDISGMEEFSYAYAHGIKSLVGVPVHIDGKLWGMLSFNECSSIRQWSESDLQLITLIGSIISAAVDRSITLTKLIRMSSIVESSPQFIAYVDTEGNFEYINKGTENALGYTPREMLEGGLGLILDSRAKKFMIRTILPRIISNGEYDFELPVIRKDGAHRLFSCSAFAISQTGVGAISTDITEQRRLEKELIAAKEQAEYSSQAKGEFLSRMSHEMRTPLNAIIGMTSIASAAADLEKKQYCLGRISDASNHLLGVINDILDMSKIEANKFELSYSEFSFEKMLARVLNVVNFRIAEKKQNMTVSIAPDMPYAIVSDEQRLAQVIANLLSNAVKFTPEQGDIKLFARLAEEKNDTVTLLVTVEDTGIGVPLEDQKKLFKSFEQADGGISRKFGGTGLGLAISMSIVKMMGGDIWLESEAGKGARFSFTFKAARGKDTRLSALGGNAEWRDLRILVVDDDPETRGLFASMATQLGFSLLAAKNEEEAEALLTREPGAAVAVAFLARDGQRRTNPQLAQQLIAQHRTSGVVFMAPASEWNSAAREIDPASPEKLLVKPLLSGTVVDAIVSYITPSIPAAGNTANNKDGNLCEHKILLVEDIAINREIVLSLLEDTGVSIDCAENGSEAYEMFAKDPSAYSIIFMDIHMPEVDGYEATRRIRAMSHIPEAASVPIIAMTANVFREDIEHCLAAGMNGHIGKPIDFDELMNTLNTYCKPATRTSST